MLLGGERGLGWWGGWLRGVGGEEIAGEQGGGAEVLDRGPRGFVDDLEGRAGASPGRFGEQGFEDGAGGGGVGLHNAEASVGVRLGGGDCGIETAPPFRSDGGGGVASKTALPFRNDGGGGVALEGGKSVLRGDVGVESAGGVEEGAEAGGDAGEVALNAEGAGGGVGDEVDAGGAGGAGKIEGGADGGPVQV